jgi:hypothetical protein
LQFGVTTDASGNAFGSVALPWDTSGLFLTATATNASGNTSEFSPCKYTLAGDSDGDGCTDAEEDQVAVGSEVFGGRRNKFDYYDFYDVSHDYNIDFTDTLLILSHFGHGTFQDSIDWTLDRDSLASPFPWQTYFAGNGIDFTDALVNLASFGHGCAGPPPPP